MISQYYTSVVISENDPSHVHVHQRHDLRQLCFTCRSLGFIGLLLIGAGEWRWRSGVRGHAWPEPGRGSRERGEPRQSLAQTLRGQSADSILRCVTRVQQPLHYRLPTGESAPHRLSVCFRVGQTCREAWGRRTECFNRYGVWSDLRWDRRLCSMVQMIRSPETDVNPGVNDD